MIFLAKLSKTKCGMWTVYFNGVKPTFKEDGRYNAALKDNVGDNLIVCFTSSIGRPQPQQRIYN